MYDSADDAIIRKFFKLGRPHLFLKGEVIVGNEQQPDGVHFIDSGYVKTFSISERGEDYGHIIYRHDEIIPIVWAYLGGSDEPVFYQALADTVTWRISRSWFLQFIRTNPSLSYALGQQLARQLQQYSFRVDNLEHRRADERVAYYLLYLCRRFGMRVGKKISIDLPLTHEVFASSVNLSRETVSRQIEKLNTDHVIATSYHHYEILDVPALEKKVGQTPNIDGGVE